MCKNKDKEDTNETKKAITDQLHDMPHFVHRQ